jgi:hypothetical protein
MEGHCLAGQSPQWAVWCQWKKKTKTKKKNKKKKEEEEEASKPPQGINTTSKPQRKDNWVADLTKTHGSETVKRKWKKLQQETTMNNNRMSKIMLNYRPNGRRRLGRPLKRETG